MSCKQISNCPTNFQPTFLLHNFGLTFQSTLQENVDTNNLDSGDESSSLVPSSQMSDETNTRLVAGKLKSIHLKNFMCHANFKVTLNDNVNVFVGLNGSGKSAILTAIAIGLGCKASTTARSTSLKDLVKRGEPSATIEITLLNVGQDAYEREVYGNEIIVTRTINANSGASNYKLKTAAGRVVSSKKADLDKLVLFLNIQVDNPVLILNQDNARSFLKDSEPKKLFTLFLKASQIETIQKKLEECEQIAIDSANKHKQLLKSINAMEVEITGIKEKHERLQSVARYRKNIDEFKNEIDWVQVIQLEKQLHEVQKQLTKKLASINEIEDFMKNRKKYDAHLKDKIRDLGTKYGQLRDASTLKDREIDNILRIAEQAKDDLSSVEHSYSDMAKKLKEFENRIDNYMKEIEEAEKNPTNVDNLKRENAAKIETLEKKKQDLAASIETAKRDHRHFIGEYVILC